jgi:rhodanese-related sulfurtransferase
MSLTDKTTFQRIPADQALALIETEPTATVFDVRDAASYQRGHLPTAAHLTQDRMPGWFRKLAKDQPVVIYCYHGNASQEFAQMFIDFRFSKVFSIDGGFEALAKLTTAA